VLEDLNALAQAEPDAIPEPIRKTMVLFEDPETATRRSATRTCA